MANLSKPWPVRSLNGGHPRTTVYSVSATNSRIFLGDFVKAGSDGTVDVAAAGNRLLGIAAEGVAANAGGEIIVFDDPDMLIRIRSDGTANETHRFNLADILATTGNTDTGESKHEVDISSAVTTTAQLRILDKLDLEADQAWGDTTILLLCQIYEHELTPADDATPGV